ncbi:hypothetical protein [Parasitella parasitica]|uniref:Uncharacterized protein n=1 Tax=Parasitella parasitica TaxID=35722 RepID=A0A0B7NLP5_9FUNG|nr:hypothetical protein [Parasitella parasitica]
MQKEERKILVAIDYDCDLNIDEVFNILRKYMDQEDYETHYIDEGKTYVKLNDMDDETWEYFTSEWCVDDGNTTTPSGYVLKKYDDWRLCALPLGWD